MCFQCVLTSFKDYYVNTNYKLTYLDIKFVNKYVVLFFVVEKSDFGGKSWFSHVFCWALITMKSNVVFMQKWLNMVTKYDYFGPM